MYPFETQLLSFSFRKLAKSDRIRRRPISVISFTLKTLEKLLDRHNRDFELANRPLHREQYMYRAGMSSEMEKNYNMLTRTRRFHGY